ncbi:MAG: M1 family aminopeptidase, partial [Singulisphaera sp.]
VVTIVASPARDFALVCSERFEAHERQVGATTVRVLGFPEHGDNPEAMLRYAAEVIPLYERWFGPYFDEEFEIAPAFFGWNGNECSGLVLLDDRVMRLPAAGTRYLDHLVTHETCHQWFWNVVGSDGYAETFMDEGLVNCFTALRLDEKYGRNAPLIVWPSGLSWLPTIGREDLRLAGYYGWRARGNTGPVVQDLKAMGNLNALFSLAYDRGGKVVGMIRNRLGEERFFASFANLSRLLETFRYDDLVRG